MADKKNPPPAAPQQQAEPSIQMIAQYVKDLSFENPHAPESLVSGWPAPETTVQITMGQQQLKDNTFECSIHFRVEAKNKQDNRSAFIMELDYGAMVTLHNIPNENIQAVLMIEVPKLIFPFVRETVASTVSKGGYPPLYLTPINFEALYMSEMRRLQAESKKAGKA